ncbi:MAG: hypothetical protein B6U78_00780 [Candidatus Aenigmarchaeota archaeon ex4484_224]|nr:MAG: hypothetical protein B6U78_00780 [Candidatus Aenigmarchaeota archaeon ex4484_224]
MNERIGTIISINSSPNCDEFYFVIEKDVGRGEFVEVETKKGKIIARITDIVKANPYLENAEIVKNLGENLFNQFPINEWEYLVAKCIPLSLISNGIQERVIFPPSPGDSVYKVDKEFLSKFLGFDENGLNIGKLLFYDLNVKLNITKTFQKHLAILATSGAGKSFLANVLIEELLSKEYSPSIFVIDPHGEYKVFSEDNEFSTKVEVFTKEKISIDTNQLSSFHFSQFLPQLTFVQRRELDKIISSLKQDSKRFDLKQLIEEIKNSSIKDKTKDALLSWLLSLVQFNLFKDFESPSLQSVLEPRKAIILDLSDVINLKEKQIIVSYFLKRIFDLRRLKKIPPTIIFVEEAHQFAPEGKEKEEAISKGIIETIAREGRKFGVSLVLISQRPIKLSTTALSQCNTFVLLRIVNPYDIKHVSESCEGMTKDISNSLPGLNVGEAFITGEAVNYPVLFKVRKKKVKESSLGINLENAVKEFLEEKRKIKEDLEAFK